MKVNLLNGSYSQRAWLRSGTNPMSLSVRYELDTGEPWWRGDVLRMIGAAERLQETRCLQVGRHCFLTGKKLFLRKAVRVSAHMTTGCSEFIDNEVWIDRREYLLLLLKGG